MFLLKDILHLVVVPVIIAVVLTALAWRKSGSLGAARAWRWWPLGVAIAGGPLLAGLLEYPLSAFPPVDSADDMIWAPIMALLASSIVPWLPRWMGTMVVVVAGVISTWLLNHHLPSGFVSATALVLLAVLPGVLYTLLLPISVRRPGPGLPLIFMLLAGVTIVVETNGQSIQLGQFALSLPAALAGVLLATIFVRKMDLWRGGLAAFILLWTGLITYGHLWAETPPLRTAILALAPLALWLGEIKPLVGVAPWRGLAVRAVAVAIPALIVGIPAALDLIKFIQDQTTAAAY